MALPRDIPTLRAHGPTHNFTRPDNVFCSASLLPLFVKCDTAPALLPVKTDHFPIIFELDVTIAAEVFQPKPNFRETIWSDFREHLLGQLTGIDRRDAYDTIGDVEAAISQLEAAIRATIQAIVPMTKPFPHMKRWYSPELRVLKKASAKVERIAYRLRHDPGNPIHAEAKAAQGEY
ncbi:hypothetical protein C8R46DRAFT_811157, partial [Mycena filopes]